MFQTIYSNHLFLFFFNPSPWLYINMKDSVYIPSPLRKKKERSLIIYFSPPSDEPRSDYLRDRKVETNYLFFFFFKKNDVSSVSFCFYFLHFCFLFQKILEDLNYRIFQSDSRSEFRLRLLLLSLLSFEKKSLIVLCIDCCLRFYHFFFLYPPLPCAAAMNPPHLVDRLIATVGSSFSIVFFLFFLELASFVPKLKWDIRCHKILHTIDCRSSSRPFWKRKEWIPELFAMLIRGL